jgi:hypothetical protein
MNHYLRDAEIGIKTSVLRCLLHSHPKDILTYWRMGIQIEFIFCTICEKMFSTGNEGV